ncbi:MAG: hypothetical protein JWQ43_114 [Glaciihabitans sp.]|nr:hypothetical protein [Glaciihabitans sp.]
MLAVFVGVTSALVFGAADFLGGLGSRRISPLRVAAVAGTVGLGVLLLAYPAIGGVWSWSTVALGAVAGVCGAFAATLLYACLATGPMSILSPLTAVVSALVPVGVGLSSGDRLGRAGYPAIALALVAVVLVGFVREKNSVRPTVPGILMAVGAGTMIGVFLVVVARTPLESGIVPLVVHRAVNASLVFLTIGVLAWIGRRKSRSIATASGATVLIAMGPPPPAVPKLSLWRPGLAFAVACGAVDAFATAALLYGLRVGQMSVIAVLTALYPAGTILLAAIVLRERIAVVQYVGLGFAVTAGVLFTLS